MKSFKEIDIFNLSVSRKDKAKEVNVCVCPYISKEILAYLADKD